MPYPPNEMTLAMSNLKDDLSMSWIHSSWFHFVTSESGKPNLPAIIILGCLLSNSNIGADNKDSEYIRVSYKNLEVQLNLSKRQIVDALKLLETLDIAHRHFFTEIHNFTEVHNALCIQLNTKNLFERQRQFFSKLEGLSHD